jgi:hypothetical protein
MIETKAEVRATPVWWQRAVDAELKRQADIDNAYKIHFKTKLGSFGIVPTPDQLEGVTYEKDTVEIDGVLFYLGASDTLYISEKCPKCGSYTSWPIPDNGIEALGRVLLSLPEDKRCNRCKAGDVVQGAQE